jgi:hypothetical protein
MIKIIEVFLNYEFQLGFRTLDETI